MAAIGGLSEIELDSMGEADADVETVKSEDDEIDLGNLANSADAAPVIKLANVLLVDSLKRGASDIHIEPYEKEFRVRFRIDGILYTQVGLFEGRPARERESRNAQERAASVFSMMRAARAVDDSSVSSGPSGRPEGALSP